jgi:septum formation protein
VASVTGFAASGAIILASGSVIRGALLRQAGVPFQVISPDVDESIVKDAGQAAGYSVAQVAQNLALAKAAVVVASNPGAYVIAADQMLEFEGAWLDKPASAEAAGARLRDFSGKSHRLITAMVLQRDGQVLLNYTGYAELDVRTLSDAFIEDYLAQMGDEVCRSVGGYQLEGLGAHLFEKAEGDFFTILGLPMLPLLEELRKHGVLPA